MSKRKIRATTPDISGQERSEIIKLGISRYNTAIVPEVCQDCYFKCLDTLIYVYQEKIDKDCQVKIQKAKTIWAANSSSTGAEEAAEVLSNRPSWPLTAGRPAATPRPPSPCPGT